MGMRSGTRRRQLARILRDLRRRSGLTMVRMIRQQRLTDPDSPLTLVAVIEEPAVRRVIGDPDVMCAQLAHVLEAAELDTVTVQVLPSGVGAHPSVTGAFIAAHPHPRRPGLAQEQLQRQWRRQQRLRRGGPAPRRRHGGPRHQGPLPGGPPPLGPGMAAFLQGIRTGEFNRPI